LVKQCMNTKFARDQITRRNRGKFKTGASDPTPDEVQSATLGSVMHWAISLCRAILEIISYLSLHFLK
jgi:hypothetical protein